MKKTRIIKSEDFEENLDEIVYVLKAGGLVVFPTETVYGIGADAMNEEAAVSIYEAKGRPQDNPLIVHISNEEQLERVAAKIPRMAKKVMKKFWPGPLTIIFNKKEEVPEKTTGGLQTVAVRMPANDIALKLIEAADTPIAAPSANISGKPSPTKLDHVVLDLFGRVDVIIDGGETEYGLESTVLDLTTETPMILRPGYITRKELEKVLKCTVQYDPSLKKDESGNTILPKSPGQKYKHYSPEAELKVFVSKDRDAVLKRMLKEEKKFMGRGYKTAIITVDENKDKFKSENVISLGSIENYDELAHNLFGALRECDIIKPDIIISEGFESKGVGRALMNRLEKASGQNIEYLD